MMKALTLAGWLGLLFLAGCSTVPSDYQDPENVPYQDADHSFKVWRADAVDLGCYDTLVVNPTKATAKPPDKPEEVAQFDRFLVRLRTDLMNSAITRNVFTNVVMSDSQVPAGSHPLHLETTILDYYAGSAATRMLVGFGAGEPHFLARSVLLDGATPLMRFVAKRKFEWGTGFGDEERLNNEVRDFAADFGELLDRARRGQNLKKR
jgi:hypothetical protein